MDGGDDSECADDENEDDLDDPEEAKPEPESDNEGDRAGKSKDERLNDVSNIRSRWYRPQGNRPRSVVST